MFKSQVCGSVVKSAGKLIPGLWCSNGESSRTIDHKHCSSYYYQYNEICAISARQRTPM